MSQSQALDVSEGLEEFEAGAVLWLEALPLILM